jgi:N-acyl homoserine lactone hydrolase
MTLPPSAALPLEGSRDQADTSFLVLRTNASGLVITPPSRGRAAEGGRGHTFTREVLMHLKRFTFFAAIVLIFFGCTNSQPPAAEKPRSIRLYVFDCGTLHYDNADAYQLKKEEVARTDMSMACFLVSHPKGTLMWDVGAVADGGWIPTGSPVRMNIVLPDKGERDVTMRKPLKAQLLEVGYSPADITYLALSHYHWDHIANSNDFAGSTWLARKPERDLMFSTPPPDRTIPANYSALANSKTVIIDKDEYDVFGDGKVILKLAPGHTPAHQVLFVDLAKTGPVLLEGDLYHYPEERSLHRVPVRDFDKAQTEASRAAIEAFLKEKRAQLWIQHDIAAFEKLKKAPEYYD